MYITEKFEADVHHAWNGIDQECFWGEALYMCIISELIKAAEPSANDPLFTNHKKNHFSQYIMGNS